ncbi:hypothetical protein DAPPUDRAFT_107647 [Daphnia pulex]|uniref:Uncharacterized protein n=1 Tax=Daphnia pulex TaxID=6669 RepID=E9GXT5_DAPPU|nr:hypothetical protein DAPPUDRAFT_107647 [Daphnia pulex]|eukprot:EFX75717.1 hypothetical protein DAPPUDRAFT_107647 [Daphnia pulex]
MAVICEKSTSRPNLSTTNNNQTSQSPFDQLRDSSLEVIGTYCTNLRELEFMDCNNITDIGVKGLCVSSTTHNLGREGDKLGLHKSLLKLGSCPTKITNAGIQLVLETFRSLKVWDIVTVQKLAEIHKEDFLNRSPEIPKYSLMKLSIGSNICDPKNFGLVLSLCPFVIDVDINITGLTDSDFISLTSLEKLCKLKLRGSDSCNVTFGGGVTTILKAFGKILKSLDISYCDVNIQAIALLCPNLHELDLFHNENYSTAKLDEELFKFDSQILKQLEKLTLNEVELPHEHFVLLLSAPSLVDLKIKECWTFNDDVLQEVARVQKLQRLESLEVENCYEVTDKGIDVLIMNAQNLKKVDIYFCDQVTNSNVLHWHERAEKNNWNISIYEESHYCSAESSSD